MGRIIVPNGMVGSSVMITRTAWLPKPRGAEAFVVSVLIVLSNI